MATLFYTFSRDRDIFKIYIEFRLFKLANHLLKK